MWRTVARRKGRRGRPPPTATARPSRMRMRRRIWIVSASLRTGRGIDCRGRVRRSRLTHTISPATRATLVTQVLPYSTLVTLVLLYSTPVTQELFSTLVTQVPYSTLVTQVPYSTLVTQAPYSALVTQVLNQLCTTWPIVESLRYSSCNWVA